MTSNQPYVGIRPTVSTPRKFAVGIAAVAAALSAAGCRPAGPGTPIPDVVGMHADKAKDALQQPNVYIAKDVNFHDVKPGETSTRMVLVSSHWKVCSQEPPAGSPSKTDMTVDLAVVKNEETCPGTASAPSPTASPTPAAPPAAQAPTPTAAHASQVPGPMTTRGETFSASTPPAAPVQQAPVPQGSCKAHTVAYCGWDRGETPDQWGETATCKDGHVSFAPDAGSGACSGHKGVRVWFK